MDGAEKEKALPAWLARIAKVRGIEWIVLIIVLGIMLVIAGDALFGAFASPNEQPAFAQGPLASASFEAPGDDSLEARLANVLSAVSGAGEVEVFIAYEGVASEAIPCGAVVVAEGANDISVRLTLQQAVKTALGLSASRVDVLPMNSTETTKEELKNAAMD